ncbi:hypothetical protein ERJ75_001414900 [Trypanosoma vivax]|uniref:DoxX n=1 Tax=Trypanosoma vivax (strain Y486) TaxID=1055687 RepID=G0TUE4_TRYVY|nr:hypothetical protein TRVL_08829 [Trypanosoma vivax]KAH8607361.1 hypothetical protein ERJ75_001414900 [Trypanosoma vivax]CCC47578.1 conserved hypothetical protein [Trypanosoma vivax Y486]
MICVLIRLIGLTLTVALFVACGFQCITNPAVTSAMLARSNFPKLLQLAGVQHTLTAEEYTLIVQGTGAALVGFSLFVVLGVGRSFFAFLLAVLFAAVTVVFHINLSNPMSISEANALHVAKNVSIVGALLFVTGTPSRCSKSGKPQAAQERPRKSQKCD